MWKYYSVSRFKNVLIYDNGVHGILYLSDLRIESDCGLAEAASILNEPIVSVQVYPISNGMNYLMAYTMAENTVELRKTLSKDFMEVNLVKGKRGTFILGTKVGHGVMEGINGTGNIPLFPVFAHHGQEHFLYISTSKDKSKEASENISENNYVSSLSVKSVNGDDIMGLLSGLVSYYQKSKLTETELKVMQEAYKSGYYEWPRPKNLGDVSDTLSLSKPTVLYHIRKAERKLLRSILE